jgi:hypothetical protein
VNFGCFERDRLHGLVFLCAGVADLIHPHLLGAIFTLIEPPVPEDISMKNPKAMETTTLADRCLQPPQSLVDAPAASG